MSSIHWKIPNQPHQAHLTLINLMAELYQMYMAEDANYSCQVIAIWSVTVGCFQQKWLPGPSKKAQLGQCTYDYQEVDRLPSKLMRNDWHKLWSTCHLNPNYLLDVPRFSWCDQTTTPMKQDSLETGSVYVAHDWIFLNYLKHGSLLVKHRLQLIIAIWLLDLKTACSWRALIFPLQPILLESINIRINTWTYLHFCRNIIAVMCIQYPLENCWLMKPGGIWTL